MPIRTVDLEGHDARRPRPVAYRGVLHADDLLPEPPRNARRIPTDAEVVTLAVAQALMGITSDARFIKAARKRLGHLFPKLPDRPGYLKRCQRLRDTIEWLTHVFASDSPGFYDDLVLVDSTRWSAPAASRRPGAASWPTRPTTATAQATAATSGASACTAVRFRYSS